MLTTQDKEEIKRLVGEMIAEFSASSSTERKYTGEVEDLDELQMFVARLRDLVVNEGFTELTFVNPATGDRRLLNWSMGSGPLVEVTARAIEVFGTREKALHWFGTPVRALGDKTPMSLLNSPAGVARVQNVLGQVEHGVW